MLVSEWQDQLHIQYQGDVETPAEGVDDWEVRLGLLLDSINAWETADKHIMWLELWTTLADAVDGTKTTDGIALRFAAPTNFKIAGGFVRLINGTEVTYYKILRPEQIDNARQNGGNVCYFTGNKRSGFYVNFFSIPAAGLTIDYPYYKYAFQPTAGTDIIEMPDPYFGIKYALSKLHELDGEGDRATLALSLANAKLNAMISNNETPVHGQDTSVPDNTDDQGGFG